MATKAQMQKELDETRKSLLVAEEKNRQFDDTVKGAAKVIHLLEAQAEGLSVKEVKVLEIQRTRGRGVEGSPCYIVFEYFLPKTGEKIGAV